MKILPAVKLFLEKDEILNLIDNEQYEKVISIALFHVYSDYNIDFLNPEFANLKDILETLGYKDDKYIINRFLETMYIVAPDCSDEFVSIEYLFGMISPAFPCGIDREDWEKELLNWCANNPHRFLLYKNDDGVLKLKYIE